MKKRLVIKIISALILIVGVYVPSASNVSATAKISYLRDISKIYVYDGADGKYEDKYIKKYKGANRWYARGPQGTSETLEKETKNGLYDYENKILSYPIKKNKKWKDKDGDTHTIKSVNKTIKTKAGTFKNVVEVEVNGERKLYYAKGAGCILIKYNNKKVNELIKIKKK